MQATPWGSVPASPSDRYWRKTWRPVCRLALAQGRHRDAVSIAAAASTSRLQLGLRRSPRDEDHWTRILATLLRALPAAEHQAAWERGCDLPIDQLVGQALALSAEQPLAA